jgi:hypothetical protein
MAVCMLPAMDNETGEFIELNYYEHQSLDPKYLFYSNEILKSNDLESNYKSKITMLK